MKLNPKKKVIIINAILFAVLFSLISFNKEVLRTNFQDTPSLKLFTDCFPNFIAAYIISMAFVTASIIRKFKRRKVIVYTSAIVIFMVLMTEEFYPLWGASEQYDIYDIFASGIGSVLSIITFEVFHGIINRKKI
jgi:hypothetical protein